MNKQDLMITKIDLEEAIASFNKKCKLLGYEEEQIKIRGNDNSFFPEFFKDLDNATATRPDDELKETLEKLFSDEVFYTSLKLNKELKAVGFESISETKFRYMDTNIFAKVTKNDDGGYLVTIV